MNDAKDPLGLDLKTFTRDLTINTTSLFVAAQQAAAVFEQLPKSASRTFIYTGNFLNKAPLVRALTLSVGKTASAHIVQIAAEGYADNGFKYV